MKLTALLTCYCIVYLYIELVDRYNKVSYYCFDTEHNDMCEGSRSLIVITVHNEIQVDTL